MQSFKFAKTNLLALSVAFIAILIVVSIMGYRIAQAETPSITVCVKNNGAIYMVGEGFRRADCRNNDQLVSWNIGGPPGPQGEVGATGPAGADGAQGPAGENGLPGAVGPQGPIGLTGANGLQGADGAQGPAGTNGAPGAVGPQGEQGIQGVAGPQGEKGIDGTVTPGPPGITQGDIYQNITNRNIGPEPVGETSREIVAQCEDNNDIALSGGFNLFNNLVWKVQYSYGEYPIGGRQSWKIGIMTADNDTQVKANAIVNCLRVPGEGL